MGSRLPLGFVGILIGIWLMIQMIVIKGIGDIYLFGVPNFGVRFIFLRRPLAEACAQKRFAAPSDTGLGCARFSEALAAAQQVKGVAERFDVGGSAAVGECAAPAVVAAAASALAQPTALASAHYTKPDARR